MRVQPMVLTAILVGVLYAPAFVGLVALSGVAYPDIVLSTENTIVRGVLIPVAILAVILTGLTSFLGWWGPS